MTDTSCRCWRGWAAGALLAVLALASPGWADVPHPGDGDIRTRLDDILARPDFKPADLTWLQKLAEALARFIAWLGELHAAAPLLYWLLLLVCGGLLGLLVVFVVRKIAQTLAVNRRGRDEQRLREERGRRSRAYREEAGRWAERGDFTEAIRCLFLSLVHRFDESGRVIFQKANTNREYLDLFDAQPHLRGDLQVFVDLLDEHWYGQHPAERARYERCLNLYDDVNRQG